MADGWTEERLMDVAGRRLATALAAYFPRPGHLVGYLGKGHNAGDVLVALPILRDRYGWEISVRRSSPMGEFAPLTASKWQAAGELKDHAESPVADDCRRPLVLLDGLLGIGASGALRDPLASLAAEMNTLREQAGARVAAVDVPSGTDPDSGRVFPGSVVADVTFMIGAAKLGLLSAQAVPAAGALAIVPIEPLRPPPDGDTRLISPSTCDFGKQPRPFEFHKGLAGRVGILAGSACYTGAAVITANGALRGGAGLVMLHVPAEAAAAVAGKAAAEVIVHPCDNPAALADAGYDAIAIGPGLGTPEGRFADGLRRLILGASVPMVLDADALNFIAAHGLLAELGDHHVLTPHPGEFKRLAPDLADLPREEAARAFAARCPATLLLKGARTLVIRGDRSNLLCNSTGTPGMACGGQGDLLTGVIAARLAGGLAGPAAAAFGAWLCGRAAERAITHGGQSEESLIPADLLGHFGGAFTDWRQGTR